MLDARQHVGELRVLLPGIERAVGGNVRQREFFGDLQQLRVTLRFLGGEMMLQFEIEVRAEEALQRLRFLACRLRVVSR